MRISIHIHILLHALLSIWLYEAKTIDNMTSDSTEPWHIRKHVLKVFNVLWTQWTAMQNTASTPSYFILLGAHAYIMPNGYTIIGKPYGHPPCAFHIHLSNFVWNYKHATKLQLYRNLIAYMCMMHIQLCPSVCIYIYISSLLCYISYTTERWL